MFPAKPPLAVPEMPFTELSGEVTVDCSVAVNVAEPLDRVMVLGEKLFCPLGEKWEEFPLDTVQATLRLNGPPPAVALTVGLAQVMVTGAEATLTDMGAVAVPEKTSWLQLGLVQIW